MSASARVFGAGRRRRESGFALASALAVVLLFAFAVAFAFMIIHEGDKKVERFRADRNALNQAESAVAVMIRGFEKKGTLGVMPPVELGGGKASGEMKLVSGTSYLIRAVGEAPIPGGENSRAVVIVEGNGEPKSGNFNIARWRFSHGD